MTDFQAEKAVRLAFLARLAGAPPETAAFGRRATWGRARRGVPHCPARRGAGTMAGALRGSILGASGHPRWWLGCVSAGPSTTEAWQGVRAACRDDPVGLGRRHAMHRGGSGGLGAGRRIPPGQRRQAPDLPGRLPFLDPAAQAEPWASPAIGPTAPA